LQGKIVFIHGLTPIHTGTGQSVDVIDLPIAREKTTGWPMIPGSSIKGVLRDLCNDNTEDFKKAFGPDTANASESAGELIFCDAHLLCMPVRSFFGTFAWVTCPGAIARLARDYTASGLESPFKPIAEDIGENKALVCKDSKIARNNRLVLEDLDFEVKEIDGAENIARKIDELVFENKGSVAERLAIVNNDTFSAITETCTEVTARIKMNEDTKTVKTGGLWYEEAIPSEAILWFPIIATPRNNECAEKLFKFLVNKNISHIQIGGHASVGRGIVRIIWGNGNGRD